MLSAIQVVRCKSEPKIERIIVHVAGEDCEMKYDKRADTYVYNHSGCFNHNKDYQGLYAVGVITMHMANGMEIELFNHKPTVRAGGRIEISRFAFLTALKAIGWRWPEEKHRG